MDIPERDKHLWELVMSRYGMRVELKNGVKYYNFEHFDTKGFEQNGGDDMHRMRKILPVDLNNELDFTTSPFAERYRIAFLKEVQRQANEQGLLEIPENTLNLMKTAYTHGFNDGSNFVLKAVNGEYEGQLE